MNLKNKGAILIQRKIQWTYSWAVLYSIASDTVYIWTLFEGVIRLLISNICVTWIYLFITEKGLVVTYNDSNNLVEDT